MLFRTSLMLLATSVLVGCATPLRISMPPDQRSAITELDAKVVVIQDEVIVDVKPSTASGAGVAFGLIGALVTTAIDSSVTNSRVKATQDLMGSFYMAIDDLDVRKELSDGIRAGLANFPVKVGQVTPELGMSNSLLRKWRDGLKPGQVLMVVVPKYVLSDDFRSFDAQTWVTLWRKDGDDKPVHRGVLHYQSALVGSGGQDSIAAWSANNAANFRAAIKEAVTETVNLMYLDWSTASSVNADQAREFPFYNGGRAGTVKGSAIKETPTRVSLLATDGKVYSLPKAGAKL